MQESKRAGEDLVPRFQRVLSELGIEVEVNEDGEGVEVTSNVDKTRETTRNGAATALGRYSRRSSFDSFFDGTADKVAGTSLGRLPIRSKHRRATSDTEAHSYQQPQFPIRNRLNGYSRRPSVSGRQPARRRSVSVSSRGSLQIRRDAPTRQSRFGDYDADDSDHTDRTTSLDLSHVQVPGINAPIPRTSRNSQEHQPYISEPFRPSDTRLLDDAEEFEHQRLHRVTRECIRIWRNQTEERVSIRNDMDKLATTFDRKILLKLSFEQLRDTARIRRSSRETERFFGRLEQRADRARNLFLLTKAFTHWAKSAEDEVQRTSVARRHILRTRFFNGWRDITAVNELKIQHFVLGKFLQQWRARAAALQEASQLSVALYEENLVHRVYREWFFKFCAIAAPAWRNDRMRKITLHKMSEIAKVLRERQVWAVDRYDRALVKKMLERWRGRTNASKSLEPQAVSFRQDSLVSTTLKILNKQAQLAPLLRQFQKRVDGRITKSALQTWHHTTVLCRQARNVDQMRIMRNAWTSWNDNLRIKGLEDRINDRIIVECLYKWTLASRVSLFQRVHERQVKESTFLSWVTKTNQRCNTLEAAERRFAQFKRAQMLRMCLHKMETLTADRRAEEYAVVAEQQQKLKQRIFETLKEKLERCQQLNKWAADAQFFVLGTRTLKTWTEASQLSRRNRRRDAYTQFRRKVKTDLVRRLFENWRDKASHFSLLNQQANDMLEDRVVHSSRALLHDWHDRALSLRQQNAQASNVYSFKLATRFFHTWTNGLDLLQRMDGQAVALRQESTELAATSAFKKLGWRLWNIRRQEENARALYERNFEKHVRAMVRFWSEQTQERLSNRPVSPTPTSRSRRTPRRGEDSDRPISREPAVMRNETAQPGQAGEAGDDTQRLEAWTPFDEGALGQEEDLDLSFSVTPEQPTRPPILPFRSSSRPTPARPNTFPQPHSALRPPPQTIPEDSILDPAFAANIDNDLADPSTFWSGTPMPPPPSVFNKSKPGYLKTPSKRSVVRAKRPELPVSPEKKDRVLSPVRRNLGAMSAPPVAQIRPINEIGGGVRSFEARLREGGFGDAGGAGAGGFSASVAVGARGGRGRFGRGKGRVGFGDVSEMG